VSGMPPEFEAELARIRAESDQSREALKEFAGILGGFFDGLVTAGFDEAQALDLTRTWLVQFLQGAQQANTMDALLRGFGLGEDK
jgi:hypothetical protein